MTVAIEFVNGGPGFIVQSVAKMNEYYLRNAGFDERQYTMCHVRSYIDWHGNPRQNLAHGFLCFAHSFLYY